MELHNLWSAVIIPCLIVFDHAQCSQGDRTLVVSAHCFRNASQEQSLAVAPPPVMDPDNLTVPLCKAETKVYQIMPDAKFDYYKDKLDQKDCKTYCDSESCKAALKLGTGYTPEHFRKDQAYSALLEVLPQSSLPNPPYDYEILLSVSTLLGVRGEKLDHGVPGITMTSGITLVYLPLQVPSIGFLPVYNKVSEMLEIDPPQARTHAVLVEGLAILAHLTLVQGGSGAGWKTNFQTTAELDDVMLKIQELLTKYPERLMSYPHVSQMTEWVDSEDGASGVQKHRAYSADGTRVQILLATSFDWLQSNFRRMQNSQNSGHITVSEPSEEFLQSLLKELEVE